MYSKYIALIVLIGLLYQGVASLPVPESTENEESQKNPAPAQGAGENTEDRIAKIKADPEDPLGKILSYLDSQDANSKFKLHAQYLMEFNVPEAKKYYNAFLKCDELRDPNAAAVCREAIRLEFYDAFENSLNGHW